MSKSEAKELAVAVFRAFAFAAVPVFVAGVSGIGAAPNLEVAKALVVSAAVGAGAVGARAVWGAIRSGQIPFPKFGF